MCKHVCGECVTAWLTSERVVEEGCDEVAEVDE